MEEAERIGLLHRTAPAAEAEAVALGLAAEIASHPGQRRLKAMFRDLEDTERRVAYENELLVEFQRAGTGLPARRANVHETG